MIRKIILPLLLFLFVSGLNAQSKLSILNDLSDEKQLFQLKVDHFIQPDTAANVLAVYKLNNAKRSNFRVAGHYSFENNVLSFAPVVRLSSDSEFEVVYGDQVKRYSPTAKKTNTNLLVQKVYPDTDSIAENSLTFYVEFSEKMKNDTRAYTHVDVVKEDGSIISLPWRQKSYWINNNKTLVLMIHPGRIKSEISSTAALEPVLKSGSKLSLRIGTELKSVDGNVLADSFLKDYTVSAKDTILPKIITTEIDPPSVNTRNVVAIQFSKEMDFGLVYKCFSLLKEEAKVAGQITTDDGQRWFFTPDDKWTTGDYTIKIGNKIGDSCHNQINRRFETKDKTEMVKPYTLDFSFIVE